MILFHSLLSLPLLQPLLVFSDKEFFNFPDQATLRSFSSYAAVQFFQGFGIDHIDDLLLSVLFLDLK
jgi:hypothetical protein